MEAHQHTDLEPIHPGSGRGKGLLKRIGSALAAIGVVLANIGAKAKLILVALPKLKLFTTSASMLVSIAAYQLIFGWLFSVGFVLLLLLHELGHVFQLRREGVKASAPMFIPFMGAVISAKSMGDDAGAEARVGLAGPILGSLATLVPLGLWLAAATTGRRWRSSASSSISSTCSPSCRSTGAGPWPRSRPGSGWSAWLGWWRWPSSSPARSSC
jgi:Zn-dependent protease